MKLLDRSAASAAPAAAPPATDSDTATLATPPDAPATGIEVHDPPPAHRRYASWLVVGAGVVAVGILAVSVLTGGDDATDTREPVRAQITDPKDRPGYRSPTTDWQYTTGDPKDHATYRLPTTGWQYTTGDAKDHAGWSPTLQR